MATDDRSEMEASRLAGLEQRHEQRLARATYTASEVKVLTETAGEAGRRIGWKTAGEEIQEALEALAAYSRNMPVRSNILYEAAEIARDIASQPPGAAPDATSGVPGHQEVSEAARSPQEPCGHPTCPCASQEDMNG